MQVRVCDICHREEPHVKIQEKIRVKRRVFGWDGDSWNTVLEICDKCLASLADKVTEAHKKGVK